MAADNSPNHPEGGDTEPRIAELESQVVALRRRDKMHYIAYSVLAVYFALLYRGDLALPINTLVVGDLRASTITTEDVSATRSLSLVDSSGAPKITMTDRNGIYSLRLMNNSWGEKGKAAVEISSEHRHNAGIKLYDGGGSLRVTLGTTTSPDMILAGLHFYKSGPDMQGLATSDPKFAASVLSNLATTISYSEPITVDQDKMPLSVIKLGSHRPGKEMLPFINLIAPHAIRTGATMIGVGRGRDYDAFIALEDEVGAPTEGLLGLVNRATGEASILQQAEISEFLPKLRTDQLSDLQVLPKIDPHGLDVDGEDG